jgi:SEC-C motif-containing protein
MSNTNLCPCHSKKVYAQCCEPYLLEQLIPLTAEALMRSRYTAYTQANIAYIQATMRGKAAEGYDPVSAEQWAKSAKWKELKVKRAFFHPSSAAHAFVEFVASYKINGRLQKIQELSEFEQREGRWYYVSGVALEKTGL